MTFQFSFPVFAYFQFFFSGVDSTDVTGLVIAVLKPCYVLFETVVVYVRPEPVP